jgi:diacylglycerol kinase (ATP)
LDLILAPELKFRDTFKLFIKAYKGLHVLDPKVISARVDEVTISQLDGSPTMPFLMADGEYVGTAPAKVEVCPKAVQIIFHPNALR